MVTSGQELAPFSMEISGALERNQDYQSAVQVTTMLPPISVMLELGAKEQRLIVRMLGR